MPTKRRRGIPIVFLLSVFIICIIFAGGFWALEQIPILAEREFGPASSYLGWFDRLNYSIRLLLAREKLLIPERSLEEKIIFEIAPGESVNSVMLRLEQSGIIPDAIPLRDFVVYSGLDTGIQAGRYEFDPGLAPVDVARELQTTPLSEAILVILPGWRAEEVAAALQTSGLGISPVEFMKVVRNPPANLVPVDFQPLYSLEGFLFPGEYHFPREATLQDVIATILGKFQSEVNLELRNAFYNNGFSLQEALTFASIVQKEGMIDEEMGMIASVFYNRLAIGMKLDSDPTAQYAYGYNDDQNTWWTNPVTANQLSVDSPYNTYLYYGLPPGPICNPGISALEAVAFPSESPYYYFRASCDGTGRHEFAVTYEEHLQNACP